jgi:hypothetical protein
MIFSGIGVQQILPRTGTGWQSANPAPDRNNDSEGDDAPPKPGRAPAAPGTGRIVDRIA